MVDEITFLDLSVLMRILPNTPLEKLGGLINSSIFDASNIAGTLKQKSLIEFSANYPGPNAMNITETGNALIREANEHTNDPFDKLDEAILQQLSGGKRTPKDLQSTLNIRSKDLAFRIYKETKQGFVTYEIKNGNVEIMLTEKGFLKSNTNPNTVTQNQQTSTQTSTQNVQNTAPTSFGSTIQNKSNDGSWLNAGEIKQKATQNNEVQLNTQTSTNTSTGSSQNSMNKPIGAQRSGLNSEKNKWIIIGVLLAILVLLYIIFELL
jgi:hypothetical protein